MELAFFISQLEANKNAFEALFYNVSGDLIMWKQAPEKWCMLEIVCHLYDEEREDFRQRFRYLQETPELAPPSINPPAWVTERNYIEQSYPQMVQKFLDERDDSIKYLKNLKNPSWDNSIEHPHFGKITARHYLHNWVMHDLLHIKQITRLKYDYIHKHSDQDLTYAGEWT